MDHEEKHHGRHRKHDDDDEKAREIEQSVEADLPPTEESIEEDAARANVEGELAALAPA